MALREVVGDRKVEIEVGGYVSFDVQVTNTRHRHGYFELCLVLSGSGRYFHGGEAFPLATGDVFLAEPSVIHEISSYETRNLHLYFLRMSMQRIGGAPTEETFVAFDQGRRVVAPGQASLAHYPPLLERRSSQFPALLRAFSREMLTALTIAPAESVGDDDGIVARALAYVEAHCDRSLRVGEVAQHLGVSERSLRRRFQESGASLLAEASHRRMRRAADQLLKGYGVAEVAIQVGIDDPAQFSRAFRRSFGVPPKQFQTTYTPGAPMPATVAEETL